MGYDIFISYSHSNKAIADAVCSSLEADGFHCWYAPRNIDPGSSWSKSIMEGIKAAKIMVIIVTDESVASPQVLREIDSAVNARLTILPFRLTDAPLPEEMQYYLGVVHWLDVLNRPLKDGIAELKSRIRRLVGVLKKQAPSEKPAAPPSPQKDPVRSAPEASASETSAPKEFPILKSAMATLDWKGETDATGVGLEFRNNAIAWGSIGGEPASLFAKRIVLSDAFLSGISPGSRVSRLSADFLSYIRDHSLNKRIPAVCIATVPDNSLSALAQFDKAASSLGVASASVIKRVSAAAVSLAAESFVPENVHSLIIEQNAVSCGIAVTNIGDGVIEMEGALQHHVAEGQSLSFDLLRNDLYKLLDRTGVKQISQIYVSSALPSDCLNQLWNLFRLECHRMDPDWVLRGQALQAGVRTGIRKDLLLLDCTDYEIFVNAQKLLEDCVSIPVFQSLVIPFRTARKDHCVDIMVRSNSLSVEKPLSFRLSVADVLEMDRPVQDLRITVLIDNLERMGFEIRNPHSGKEMVYKWDQIRDLMLASS